MTTVNGGSENVEVTETRSSMIAIRVTPTEHELIRARALDAGITVTDLIVRAALGADAVKPKRLSSNEALEERIERIERILIDAGVILDPAG